MKIATEEERETERELKTAWITANQNK